jgi:hypothetical protein
MMIGGALESISIGGRIFSVPEDADFNTDLGGYTNDVQSNGDLTTRKIKKPKPWSIKGGSVAIDQSNGDLEYLQQIADQAEDAPIVATYANGEVYQGVGTIVEELAFQNQNATVPLSLAGPGVLSKQ